MVAARQLMWVFQLLAVVAFGFVAVSIAQAYTKSDFVIKNNLADDIQMMINTLVAVPGEAVVKVPYNTSAYGLLLTNTEVAIIEGGESRLQWTIRPFFLPKGYHAEGSSASTSHTCLEKKERKITLRGCFENER